MLEATVKSANKFHTDQLTMWSYAVQMSYAKESIKAKDLYTAAGRYVSAAVIAKNFVNSEMQGITDGHREMAGLTAEKAIGAYTTLDDRSLFRSVHGRYNMIVRLSEWVENVRDAVDILGLDNSIKEDAEKKASSIAYRYRLERELKDGVRGGQISEHDKQVSNLLHFVRPYINQQPRVAVRTIARK